MKSVLNAPIRPPSAAKVLAVVDRWFVPIYFAMLALCGAMGYRFGIRWRLFQLLGADVLTDHLAQSLLYLHMQPPMLNLLLGLALKLERATGISPQWSLFMLHALLGLAALLGLRDLARRFIPETRRLALFLTLLLINPAFYYALFSYFYMFHEMVILAVLGAIGWRFFERPSLGRYAAICALLVLLSYTRSLFHFLFTIGLMGEILVAGVGVEQIRRGVGGPWKMAGTFILAAALVLAWPLKNQIIFGAFTYSTWQGYNMSQGLARDPAKPFAGPAPAHLAGIPALAEGAKIDGEVNWNRYGIIPESREAGANAMRALRAEPMLLVQKIVHNYWNFTRFTARHPHYGSFGEFAVVPDPAIWWMKIYEAVTLIDARGDEALMCWDLYHWPPKPWQLSALTLLLPIILLRAVRKTVQVWRAEPVRAKTAAMMLACVGWVLAMNLLVDGLEGNRMRFSTEPFLMLLALWVFEGWRCAPDRSPTASS